MFSLFIPVWHKLKSIRHPQMLLLPVLAGLLTQFHWGEHGVLVFAISFPVVLILCLPGLETLSGWSADRVTGLMLRPTLIARLDHSLQSSVRKGRATGALVLEIDRFKQVEERYDRQGVERILKTTADRLRLALRDSDLLVKLDGPSFGVGLSPVRRLDLEAAIQLASRIQQSLSEPIAMDGANIYLTVSVGFSLAERVSNPTGDRILRSATSALVEAQRYAPGAIRSYSELLEARINARSELCDEVGGALARNEIHAYFQPQVSTETGIITGFEALARWRHPQRGLIPPIEFLPALHEAGLMDKVGETMVRDALTALRRWDDNGFRIPRVGVNFSNEELRDPRLVDRISNELDRFNLSANRLAVEVLETVVANHSDDIIMRNLDALAKLGCSLDLDDFGTGHASITSIRHYKIERIKIDRSFVTRIDADPEQQKMVAAILTMAERLGLDTLAEGVETPGEHKMLAGLGCAHIQGFGISRPLAPEDVDDWIRRYAAGISKVVPLNRKAV